MKSDEYFLKSNPAIVRPFIYKNPSKTSICIKMLSCLLIQLIMLAFSKSFASLVITLSCAIGAVVAFLFRYYINKDRGYEVCEYILSGVLAALLLPESFPPVTAGVITFFVIMLTRYFFIKETNNWICEAALTVALCWFIGKYFFPDFLLTADQINSKNPSLSLIQSGLISNSSIDSYITQALNQSVFKILRVSIPDGYFSFFWDNHSVIPAFRFNIITVISSIFLFSDDSLNPVIPSVFIFVYAVLVRLFVPLVFGGVFNSGDILLALFSSGTLFCGIFLLQWFSTVPYTLCGKIIYAFLAGVMAFLITGCGTSPVGMVFTILASNILSVLIKVVENKRYYINLRKIFPNHSIGGSAS
ncbi:MAG: RnfABCDGE type electron transport complex subunit D [Treponema sp.]|nr:RnfABCDGE type electron transport complex subunit D [Clostridia bacterium]MCF0241884.1 RnfABCDGE type electron transport complex subunit D [Treponema sp.]